MKRGNAKSSPRAMRDSYMPLQSKKSLHRKLADPKFREAFVSSRIAQTIATQIRTLRQKEEMSQKDLARELRDEPERHLPAGEPSLWEAEHLDTTENRQLLRCRPYLF